MSALKYYAEWKDRKRISHRIEIHDVEASSGTAELIMLHNAIKKIPTFNLWEKENVCIGEGFTLELISESRLHFLPQLYTPYIKKFMVIHKINTVIHVS